MVAELSDVIAALQQLSAEELKAGGMQVEDAGDDVDDPVLIGRDGVPVETWREGYPYDARMTRTEYDDTKRLLQIELLKAQRWIKAEGIKVVVLFEGRDAAGKGSTIKRFMEHLDPRGARVVALSAPTALEAGQWYFQRYVSQLPSRGEIVLFDRSWYNRAGVERVMGFCTDAEYDEFLRSVCEFEQMLVNAGTVLVKLWFSVSRREQLTRFTIRRIDPVRQWKLSPMDLASLDRWDDYTTAKEAMFAATHSGHAPWTIVRSNDKKRGRVEALRHVLSLLEYPERDDTVVRPADPLVVGSSLEMVRDVGEGEPPA